MSGVRDLALAKLRQLEAGQRPGQDAGQQVSHASRFVSGQWDSANPQESAKNGQVSRCPTPIGPGQRDSASKIGTVAETTGGTDPRLAAARVREWWAHLSRLDPCKPPSGFSLGRWQTLFDCSVWWLNAFAMQAAADGWSTADVFGIHRAGERCGGLIDRLGDNRSLVMNREAATWRSWGEQERFLRGAYPELQPLWERRS